jgi:hypothetical protein
MLVWDRFGFHKKHTGRCYTELGFASGGICGPCSAFRSIRGAKRQCTTFHACVDRYGFQKKASGHVTSNLCFVSSGIYRSCSAFRCIWGAKRRCTTSDSCVGPVRIPEKVHRDNVCQTCFLHPEVSVGHVVHSGASGTQNIEAQFFMLRWDWCSFHKKRIRTSYVKLVFLHPGGYVAHVV